MSQLTSTVPDTNVVGHAEESMTAMTALVVAIFAIMLLLTMFGISASLAPGLSLKNALLYVTLGLLTFDAIFKRRGRALEVQGIHFLYAGLLVYATLSWLMISYLVDYSGYKPVRSFITLKGQLYDKYIVFLVFFYAFAVARQAELAIGKIAGIFIIAHVIILIDHFNVPDLGFLQPGEYGRLTGVIREPNQSGVMMIVVLPLTIALALSNIGKRRLFFAMGSALIFAVLVLGVSRGAIVGLTVGSIGASFVLRKHLDFAVVFRFLAVGALIATVVIAVIMIEYRDMLELRLFDVSSSTNLQTVSSGRVRYWSSLLKLMFENPVSLLIGYGWDSYETLNETGVIPHNTYLFVLFELGIIGLTFFCSIFWLICRIVLRAIRTSVGATKTLLMGIIFGLYSMLVAIFFTELFAPWLFIWALLGLITRVAIGAPAANETTNVKKMPRLRIE